MSSPITKHQIKYIHQILPDHIKADKEEKAAFIAQFTGSVEKASTKDLSYYQANDLISALKGEKVIYNRYAFFDKKNKQHLYILSLCQQIGWVLYSEKQKRPIADLNKLGKWLADRGYLHKPLKEYNAKELPKLVYQLEQILAKK